MQPGRGKRPAKSPQKILPKMHEMSAYVTEMVRTLPRSDSEGKSKEELEYPGKGATLMYWEEFHNQQMQLAQYKFDKKVKAVKKIARQM